LLLGNFIANSIGTTWVALVQLAVLPFYLKYLGAEGYGLVGLHVTLTAVAALSDLGLSATLNRGISTLSSQDNAGSALRTFLRSLEIIYWILIAVCTLLAVVLLPPAIIGWVKISSLSTTDVAYVAQLMAVQIGLQLLIGFYTSGLLGLQKHVLLNQILVASVTVRCVGAVLALTISPKLDALFSWLIVASAIQVVAMAVGLVMCLPVGQTRFRVSAISDIWRYASGMTGIVALSIILTQIDKVILSRTISLAEFGVYSLASTIAMTLCKPISPLTRTVLPRMTQMVAQNDGKGLARIYHLGAQLASLLVLPMAAVVILFSDDLVMLAFGFSSTPRSVSPLLAILAVGYTGTALLQMPYMVSLAYGWVRFGLYQNLLACIVMVPMTLCLVEKHGAKGGAIAWAVVMTGSLLSSLYLLHRRLLPAEYAAWYLVDTIPAVLAAGVSVTVMRYLVSPTGDWFVDAALLGLVFLVAFTATALALRDVRRAGFVILRKVVVLTRA
jgi:O-antigen/teichoic acid export membrane protein